jgi:hypothetical protein
MRLSPFCRAAELNHTVVTRLVDLCDKRRDRCRCVGDGSGKIFHWQLSKLSCRRLGTCREAEAFVCHKKIFEALLWCGNVCQMDTPTWFCIPTAMPGGRDCSSGFFSSPGVGSVANSLNAVSLSQDPLERCRRHPDAVPSLSFAHLGTLAVTFHSVLGGVPMPLSHSGPSNSGTNRRSLRWPRFSALSALCDVPR